MRSFVRSLGVAEVVAAIFRGVLALLAAVLPACAVAADFGFTLADRSDSLGGAILGIEFLFGDPETLLVGVGDQALLFEIGPAGELGAAGTLGPLRGKISKLAVHGPTGRTAVASDSGEIAMFDLATRSVVTTLRAVHRKGVTSMAFSSDGRYLVTGGAKGELRFFSARGAEAGELKERGMGHDRRVLEIFAIPPGRRVLTVGEDRRVILWDLDTRRAIRPSLMDMDIRSAAMGGGETLALGLELLRGNVHRRAGAFRDRPTGPITIRDTGAVSARETSVTDTVRILDPRSGNRLLELKGSAQSLDTVAVTPDGRFVAASGSKAIVSIFDTSSGQIVTEMPTDQPATAMRFSRNGNWFVVGTERGMLTLFELTGVVPAAPSDALLQTAPIQVVLIEPNILIQDAREAGEIPEVHRSSLEIRGRVQSEVPLKSISVNGRDITSLIPIEDDILFTAFVPLAEAGRHQIDISAKNLANATWQQSFVVNRVARVEKAPLVPGARRALIVGVSRYADSSINLQFATRDAESIRAFLTSPARGPGRFKERDILMLTDERATVANINRGLREFLQKARDEDFVLVFFAAHGMPDPRQLNDLYILAHDTRPDSVAGTGIPMHHIREAISQIRARDVLILADTCHSAGMSAPRGMRNLRVNPIHSSFLEKMRHSSGGMAILTASEASQASLEGAEWNGHGVFTYFLLRGLEGAADHDNDQIIALGELMEYVRRGVMDATGREQIPAIGPTSFDRQYPLVPLVASGQSQQ